MRPHPVTSTDDSKRTVPELLAPAGGLDALRAAVNNGADAVYLGVGEFNARRGAENFTVESLKEACDFAHLHGVSVYLAVNILILPEEMERALGLVDEAWAAGVDAVILQDLGLMRVVRHALPDVRIHASTQVGTHNGLTIAELERLGVARITLARETSLSEIAELSRASSVELESFVHGALCFSYSGQCLMSSLIGRRSGNRGLCAQPCRLPYEIMTEDGKSASTPGAYLLSPRDIAGLDLLPRFLESGVAALKIEGRMKSPEYVALVTGVYRAALDRAIADPEGYSAKDAERAVLEEAFSRGFSTAYLEGVNDNEMMSYTRPNNRGVRVGRVSSAERGTVVIDLECTLEAADTIEFWTSRGRVAQKAGNMRLKGKSVRVGPASERVELDVEGRVSVGDRVFRVVNAALENGARRTFERERAQGRIPIDVAVRVVEGETLRIEISGERGAGVAEGPIVERARTKSVMSDEIVDHVGRFGGTPYEASSWDIELQPGVGISFSTLHRTRREALDAFEHVALAAWSDRQSYGPETPVPAGRKKTRHDLPEVVAWCLDPDTARRCIDAGADRVIMPSWLAGDAPPSLNAVPELPRIAHDREIADLLAIAKGAPRVVVGNLGLVRDTSSTGSTVEAHWGLNVANPWTSEVLAGIGANFTWLSPELSRDQITRICEASAVPNGIAVYGRQEVMVTEHCVLMAEGPCNQQCDRCHRRSRWRFLKDSKGYRFPVTTDPAGRSHVFNSVPLDLSRALADVLGTGVRALRLDFVAERPHEAARIVRSMRSRLKDAYTGEPSPVETLVEPATGGHFYRGVI